MTEKRSLGRSFAQACLHQNFGSVHHIASCPSTSLLAKEWHASHGTHGSIVITSDQTQGRGRRGRTWLTYEGSLAFSVFLNPSQLRPIDATAYTFLAGAVLVEALSSVVPVLSKWPNDILIERPGALFGKVAGILVEAASHDGEMQGIVVGIGINIEDPAEGFPAHLPWACSLDLTDLDAFDRLASRLAHSIEKWLLPLNAVEKLPMSLELLEKASVLANRRISVDDQESHFDGQFEGFSEDGALLIRSNSGQLERVITGDVSFDGYGQKS